MMTKPPLPILGLYTDNGQPAVELLKSRILVEDFQRLGSYEVRVQRFDGTWTEPYTRNVLTNGESGDAAVVLPYDPERDAVVLIEQFRLPAFLHQHKAPWLLEIVCGLIGIGESPDIAARRETEEESGCQLRRIEKIGQMFSTPGCLTELLHFYIAEVTAGSSGTVHGMNNEHENIRRHVVPFEDALKLADTGVIEDLKSVFALNWLARHHDSLRHRWLNTAADETDTSC